MVKQEPISVTLAARQLTWIGHMLRRQEDEPIKKYALYGPKELLGYGKAKRGAPKLTYIKQVACQLNPGVKENEVKLEAKEIEEMARDRKLWGRRVIDCTGTKGYT